MAGRGKEFYDDEQFEAIILSLELDEKDIEKEYFDSLVAEVEDGDLTVIFACDYCGKTLKTGRSLARHKQKQHNQQSANSTEPAENQFNVVFPWKDLLVKTISKLLEEGLQSDEVISELNSFSLSLATSYDDVSTEQCLSSSFNDIVINYIGEVEKFYPTFYKAVTLKKNICGLSKKASTVVGFELANHVLSYYRSSQSAVGSQEKNEISSPLNEKEVAVVTYIGGYVFAELYRRIRKSNLWESDVCQQKLALLKSGKINEPEIQDIRFKLIKSRDRGGLWYVDDNVIGIFTETEKTFKSQTQDMVRSIDFNSIVNVVVSNSDVLSYTTNIESNSDIVVEKEALLDFVEEIVLLYVRVRAHSFAKDKVQKHKEEFRIKKAKSLRTELKRAAES